MYMYFYLPGHLPDLIYLYISCLEDKDLFLLLKGKRYVYNVLFMLVKN